jgi:hypothetical protein
MVEAFVHVAGKIVEAIVGPALSHCLHVSMLGSEV